jgi:hypothetical protein
MIVRCYKRNGEGCYTIKNVLQVEYAGKLVICWLDMNSGKREMVDFYEYSVYAHDNEDIAVKKPKEYLQPPIGLCPRYIADTQRAREILAAMDRYLEAGKVIPAEWFRELSERITGAVRPIEEGEQNENT